MKLSLIIIFHFFSFNIIAQNINGTYEYKYNTFFQSVKTTTTYEIRIINDSICYTRVYNVNKFIKDGYLIKNLKGEIRKNGEFYTLREYDSVTGEQVRSTLKISKRKIIFYTLKSENKNKLVKAFQLRKTSI